MKLFKYMALSGCILSLGLTSCSDFLDKNPDERTDINTETKVVDLLKTSYPNGSYQWLGELLSDNIIDVNTQHIAFDPETLDSVHYNRPTFAKWEDELFRFDPITNGTYSDSDSPGYVWSTYFSSVTSANYALKAIKELSNGDEANMSNTLKGAKAEALLIRVYDYLVLTNLFCQPYGDEATNKKNLGLPYVTEPSTELLSHHERGDLATTYSMMQKDLEEALSLVRYLSFSTAPKYHFNSDAAHALAARFYLYTRQWQKVVEQASAVFEGKDPVSLLVDYTAFADCSTLSDYANAWQRPSRNDNLMLLLPYSQFSRRAAGYRYASTGQPAKDIFYHSRGACWNGCMPQPSARVSGYMFSINKGEYGFFPAKCNEQFQYTNKVSGIGYAHGVLRAFTASELLLERAEAYTMLKQYNEAMADLISYEESRQKFDTANQTYYSSFVLKPTEVRILSYYKNASNPNCLDVDGWTCTQKVSSDYVIDAAAVPYMNAINDYRRYETYMDGLRFFDLRRWGMEIVHRYGYPQQQQVVIKPGDPRLSVEVPWEVISAGFQPSRETSHSELELTK